MQRFSSRREKSHWSELNKERCRWLIRNGLMEPAGFDVLPDLDEEFEIDDDILEALREDEEVWSNFQNFPDLYRRMRISRIQSERKDKDSFDRMLAGFIKNTRENRKTGNWNDYGKLG